jgi:hypothetical protein
MIGWARKYRGNSDSLADGGSPSLVSSIPNQEFGNEHARDAKRRGRFIAERWSERAVVCRDADKA